MRFSLVTDERKSSVARGFTDIRIADMLDSRGRRMRWLLLPAASVIGVDFDVDNRSSGWGSSFEDTGRWCCCCCC